MTRRTYPRWGGIQSVNPRASETRKCTVCGAASTRVGVVQHSFSRGDDETFGLCASNECRDQLRAREDVQPEYPGAR